MVRKSATGNLDNIYHIINNEEIYNKNFFIHHGDMLDSTSLYRIISSVMPDEIYNEADQDHVGWSYDMVGYSTDITSSAVAKILELVRLIKKNIRFFQPCSSNMYGISDTATQNESTKFNPQSPYAIAKTSAYYFTKYYRENFGIHASVGILYNHESPRRTPEYVSRKITKSVARIYLKKQKELVIVLSGSLDLVVFDGHEEKKFSLNRSFSGLYIPNGLWRHLENFSTNTVVLIVSNTLFEEKDYTRDKDEFLKLKQNENDSI